MTNDDSEGPRLWSGEKAAKAEKVRQVIKLLEAAIRECEQYLRSIEEGTDEPRK